MDQSSSSDTQSLTQALNHIADLMLEETLARRAAEEKLHQKLEEIRKAILNASKPPWAAREA